MTKTLPDVPGKEGLIETVLLSPGEVVPGHQHNADVFAYVPDGSIITQLKGGKPQTVHTGEVFYESPTDIHIDSRNASKTQPAELLVFFGKKDRCSAGGSCCQGCPPKMADSSTSNRRDSRTLQTKARGVGNSYETDIAQPFRISHRGGRGQDCGRSVSVRLLVQGQQTERLPYRQELETGR